MKKLLLTGLLIAPLSQAAYLGDKPSELVLSGTGGVASGSSGYNSVALFGEYLRHLTGPIQLGAEAGINYFWSEGFRGTGYSLLLGPTFNLSPDDFENSAFLTARGGAVYTHNFGITQTNAVLDFGLGHRFQIFENVVYRPQVTLQRTFGKVGGWTAGIEPVAFSIVF